MELYFGYGSNLNSTDWDEWCGEHGYRTGLLEPLFPAYLPDRQLRFGCYSQSRKGGVLDVRESIGHVTQGVVFRVHGEGWEALDQKEGAPRFYRRFRTECLKLDGRSHAVTAYEVCPDRREPYVHPGEAYLKIVREGFERHDLDQQPLDEAAANAPDVPLVQGLFVYGTLMRSECHHEILRRSEPCCTLLAETCGQLHDCGEFPALILSENDTAKWIQGEFVRLRTMGVLKELDALEGFRGWGKNGALFRRRLIEVGMRDGRVRQAWTYEGEAAIANAVGEIDSGDWREYRGVKAGFLKKLVEAHWGGDQGVLARRLVNRGPFSPSDEASQARDLLPLEKALAEGRISERQIAQVSGLWNAGTGS
jgi:gamma-glutamylcyclotransferase (GGCT)/AIG2-like uncharacterized protein YtfP